MHQRYGLLRLAAVFVVAVLLAGSLSPGDIILGVNAGIYIILALGLCAIFSYAGLPSLAQGMFVTCAAYISLILSTHDVASEWLAPLIAIVFSPILAWVLGLFILRLPGFYFAITTLLLSALTTLIVQLPILAHMTGGYQGATVPQISVGPLDFADLKTRYYIVWGIAGATAFVFYNLERSRYVRAARAVRANELAAELSGVSAKTVRARAFVLSAIPAAIAGVLLSQSTGYISPDGFGLNQIVVIFVAVIVGGRYGLWGAIWGALFVTVVNKILVQLELGTSATAVYGALLAAVLMWSPDGLVGIPTRTFRRLKAQKRNPSRDIQPRRPDISKYPNASASGAEHANGELARFEADRVSVCFGDFQAVRDVSFLVEGGEALVIMGPNGAGKTSLLDALSGFSPFTGSVRLDGRPLGSSVHAIRRQGVARALQTPYVFGGLRVWENIALGLDFRHDRGLLSASLGLPGSRQTESRIRANAVRLAEQVGLEPLVDQRASTLSIGQRRLVEIARALGGGSRVLLLDEPLAGLSPAMADSVVALIENIRNAGHALIVIEHNIEYVASFATDTIFMSGGAVLRQGPLHQILTDTIVREQYVGI